MAHMHNIWFNKINNAYQLAKFPELEDTSLNNEGIIAKSWIVIGTFEADTLETVVSNFTSISNAHQNILKNMNDDNIQLN